MAKSQPQAQPHKSDLALQEETILDYWQKNRTFEKSLEGRQEQKPFIFYDGPPFANGLPHLGHIMTSTLKDAITRYQTMKGRHVPRRFGWDCHGLPPEMLAEKELGVSGKIAIQAYGVDKFNQYCRESVMHFSGEWQASVTRMARWVDFEDDYRTMDLDYMESVIWAFKALHDKGLIYEGERVVPYSYGAQTALANFETRQDDSFRDREDLTVTVSFRLADGRKLLGWTTTPWTLPANLLLAINPDLDYIEMHLSGDVYVIAEAALERYVEGFDGATRGQTLKGADLVGLSYAPLFPYFEGSENSFRVVAADFVESTEGTGVVHIAPGHGEDDYWLGKAEQVPIVSPVDDEGRFTNEVKDYVGRLVFDANGEIVADLEKRHQLFASHTIIHKYPHCWRTDVPIIYRAMSAWFVDVPKIKAELLAANKEISWYPNHVKDGAFGKWLENAREWNVSRKRFWGAPLPVWKTADGEILIVGSLDEIRQRAVDPSLVTGLHRPEIDAVKLKTDSGKIAERIPDVFDCWFESGSMPFAQMHYPFENKDRFEAGHPADFITEYIGQTRGWFYTLHVMSVALFGKPAFTHAVAHGILLGNDGRKISKRLLNYPDLADTFDSVGADATRFYLLSSPLFSGETAILDARALSEAQRNVVQRLNNVLSFYTMYAEVDGFRPARPMQLPTAEHSLDSWILARLDETIRLTTLAIDAFDTPRAMREISLFLDDLSNWYVRRSRRRFWKSGDDTDKQQAYETLHYVLITTAQLMAPWTPFVAERVWQSLMKDIPAVPESVHLSDWPLAADNTNQAIVIAMKAVREIVTEGLSQRAAAGVKVRQPLAKVAVTTDQALPDGLKDIIAEELNVKQVLVKVHTAATQPKLVLDTKLTAELQQEGLIRDIIRHIQSARKAAGLAVDDRIALVLEAPDETINRALREHVKLVQTEVLATQLELTKVTEAVAFSQTVSLQADSLTIGITRLE